MPDYGRDTNIGTPQGDNPTKPVADVTVVTVVNDLRQDTDALREEVKRIRRTGELVLGQEVVTNEED